jgi:hypothetical protein
MEKKTYRQFHKQKGPGVLVSLGLLAALYSQWTDGGIWRVSAIIGAIVLAVGYVVGMLRNPDG